MTLLVVLVVLATFRATRLVTADSFPPVKALRRRVARRWGDQSWQAYLVECPWCVSPYVGAVIVAGTVLLTDTGLVAPVLVWAAASALTGIVATLLGLAEEPDEDEE